MKILKLIGVVALLCCISSNSLAGNSKINAMQTQKKTMILNQLTKGDLISTEIKELGDFDRDEVICLALNIYNETRGSTLDDQIASTYTVFNRLYDDKFPLFYSKENKTICNIVFDRYQYCWTNPSKITLPKEKDSWKESQILAYHLYKDPKHIELAKQFSMEHYVVSSMFKQKTKLPRWIKRRKVTVNIGSHSYMRIYDGDNQNQSYYYDAVKKGKLLYFGSKMESLIMGNNK